MFGARNCSLVEGVPHHIFNPFGVKPVDLIRRELLVLEVSGYTHASARGLGLKVTPILYELTSRYAHSAQCAGMDGHLPPSHLVTPPLGGTLARRFLP